MPPRIGQEQKLGRCYIRERRKQAGMSQDKLVDALRDRLAKFSKSSLSRIENGLQPYSQPILEAIAEVLRCQPADLLRPIPKPETELQRYVSQLSELEQARALRLLKAVRTEEVAA